MKNFIFILFVLFVLFSYAGCGTKSYLESQSSSEDSSTESTEEASEASAFESEAGTCWVQVDGAVNSPGVYELASGSRVYEAIELAGGLTEEAYTKTLNQVRLVEDGEMIYVSTEAEALAEAEAAESDGLININTATLEQLQTLPGIGESKAQAIIDYRESTGLFESIEDLTNVSGIGDSTYSKLSGYIKVE